MNARVVPEPILVQLNSATADALDGALVVTPNQRLARELPFAFDAAKQAQGRHAWRVLAVVAADALPSLLLGCFDDVPALLDPALQRVDAFAHLTSREAYRDTNVDADTEHAPTVARVDLYLDAQSICDRYLIEPHSSAFESSPAAASFREFAARTEQAQDRRGVLDHNRVRRHLLTRLRAEHNPGRLHAQLERKLVLYGFDVIEPWLKQVVAQLTRLGITVEQLNTDYAASRRSRVVSTTTVEQELTAVAQFARQTLEADPSATIGVVVPDLEQRRDAVMARFLAEFCPSGRSSDLIDTSGGEPLADFAGVEAALLLLSAATRRLHHERARRLLANPFLRLGEQRRPAGRAIVDPDLPALLHLRHLTRSRAINDAIDALPKEPVTLAKHALAFLKLLESAAWGQSASATQYQAITRARSLLLGIAESDEHSRERTINASHALQTVDDAWRAQRFAAESRRAPVNVLGYLETTGLRFSALWVVGMNHARWPMAARLNPLIPRGLQAAAGVPRIDATAEVAFARRHTQHWLASADRVVFSYARADSESSYRASGLLSAVREVALTRVVPKLRAHSHPNFEPQRVTLESRVDEVALNLREATELSAARRSDLRTVDPSSSEQVAPTVIRGGAGRVRDQAHCPFRAFAVHELRLREPRLPHSYPDALDRGILVHELLQALYPPAGSGVDGDNPNRTASYPRSDPSSDPRSDPRSDTQSDIKRDAEADAAGPATESRDAALIAEVVAQVFERFAEPIRSQEADRLAPILASWRALDSQRQPFELAGLELDEHLTTPMGWQLRLRIDRIESHTKGYALVDYKTGAVSIRGLRDGRLTEPQLPLYSLLVDNVQAVFYAAVANPDVALTGLASREFERAAQPVPGRLTDVDNFSELKATWVTKLNTLFAEIDAGYAAVDPQRADTCRRCHIRPLCRIAEPQ